MATSECTFRICGGWRRCRKCETMRALGRTVPGWYAQSIPTGVEKSRCRRLFGLGRDNRVRNVAAPEGRCIQNCQLLRDRRLHVSKKRRWAP
ncbi:hypothetical protein TNIN_473591 [Trichonephila inaurata madagascariensis]|uniref:Uncharacterized protein n=1 Tax=Trichonephila inaurata madagascariensis TaxID=2747483 RepID=A0A8X6Y040_9ARAC|nr:hypothetical protein TNIN_473591 [Trichonephila inaurata madagascariensis]